MTQIRQIRREEIIAAAFEEFCENGFDRARMEVIARRAGIGKSTIYEYFPSKIDLLEAVANQMTEHACAQLDRILTEKQDFRRMILDYLRFMHRLMVHAGTGLMMLRGSTDLLRIVHDCGDRRRDSVLCGLTAAAADARARGEISANIDPQAVAWALVGMGGPGIPEGDGWEAHLEQAVDVLFQGLAP